MNGARGTCLHAPPPNARPSRLREAAHAGAALDCHAACASCASARPRASGRADARTTIVSPGPTGPRRRCPRDDHGRELRIAAGRLPVGHQQDRLAGRGTCSAPSGVGSEIIAAVVRAARARPSSRYPMRSDWGRSRYGARLQRGRTLRASNQSTLRPGRTRTGRTGVTRRDGVDRRSRSAHARSGRCTERCRCQAEADHRRQARGPHTAQPATRCVARLPSTRRHVDAAGHRQVARASLACASPNRSVIRRGSAHAIALRHGLPSSAIANSAPVTATRRRPRIRAPGPRSVTSRVAASSALPTSALARRCDQRIHRAGHRTPRDCIPSGRDPARS